MAPNIIRHNPTKKTAKQYNPNYILYGVYLGGGIVKIRQKENNIKKKKFFMEMSEFFNVQEFFIVSSSVYFNKKFSLLMRSIDINSAEIEELGWQVQGVIAQGLRVYSALDCDNLRCDTEIMKVIQYNFKPEVSKYLGVIANLTQLKFYIEQYGESCVMVDERMKNLRIGLEQISKQCRLVRGVFQRFLDQVTGIGFLLQLEDMIKRYVKDSRDFIHLLNVTSKLKYLLNHQREIKQNTISQSIESGSQYSTSYLSLRQSNQLTRVFDFKRPQNHQRTIKKGISSNSKFRNKQYKVTTKFNQQFSQLKNQINSTTVFRNQEEQKRQSSIVQQQYEPKQKINQQLMFDRGILALNSSESSRNLIF